jgi:hypothetical protein
VRTPILPGDVLHTVVFLCPKGNWQCYRTNRCGRISWNDAIEWSLAWGEHLGYVLPHPLQSAQEEQVEAAPTIDEYSGDL